MTSRAGGGTRVILYNIAGFCQEKHGCAAAITGARPGTREVIDHLTRVVLDTADERGLAPPQHGQPQGVQSRAGDHAALVVQLALRVDDRHVEPPVVRPETRRPHDRGDLATSQVKLQPRRLGHACRRETLGRAGLSVIPLRLGPLVERVQQALHLEVREREHVPQATGEQRAAVTYRRPAAYQLDAHRGERVEIQRRPLGGPDELGRRQPPGPGEILNLVVPLVPHARRVHPPQHIASAVRARQPHVLPHRESHRPTRPPQLGGQLHAGRRGSHDEHAAVG